MPIDSFKYRDGRFVGLTPSGRGKDSLSIDDSNKMKYRERMRIDHFNALENVSCITKGFTMSTVHKDINYSMEQQYWHRVCQGDRGATIYEMAVCR